MQWTDKDVEFLRQFRHTVDYDGIKVKERVKKILLDNRFIIHVLNNKELEDNDAEPADYFGINILPYYMIQPTQTDVQNFICYTVGFKKEYNYNHSASKIMFNKIMVLTFVIMCEQKNIIDRDTSLPRTDLLAALIQDQFNNTNYLGATMRLMEDQESVVDNKYAARTLVFHQLTDNNLVRTRDGIARLANKDLYAEVPQSED